MAINETPIPWLGYATTTRAIVCGFCNVDGVLSITIGGVTFSSSHVTSALTKAANYGVGIINLTGLEPNTRYPYTDVYLNGVSIGQVSIRTMPEVGGSYKAGVISCVSPWRHATPLPQFDSDLCLLVLLGDCPYADLANHFQFTNTDIKTEVNVTTDLHLDDTQWALKHLNFRLRTDIKRLIQRTPSVWMMDDHETVNGWAHSVSESQITAVNTITEVNDFWKLIRPTWAAFAVGNPPQDTSATPELPPANTLEGSGETRDVNEYPAQYFRMTVGDQEYFILDHMSHHGRPASDSTLLGSTQLAWLKAQLAASTATIKVVLAPKQTSLPANEDTWRKVAPTELDSLLNWIDTNVTGVIWMCGDRHDLNVCGHESGGVWDGVGDPPNHLCINIAPAGQNHANDTYYGLATIWRAEKRDLTGTNSADWEWLTGVGQIEGSADNVRISIKRPEGGEYWHCVYDGTDNASPSNVYEDFSVAI